MAIRIPHYPQEPEPQICPLCGQEVPHPERPQDGIIIYEEEEPDAPEQDAE